MKEFTNLPKRFFKGMFLLFSLTVLLSGSTLLLDSCKNEESEVETSSHEFVSSYNHMLEKLSSTIIVTNKSNTAMRSAPINEDEPDDPVEETILVYLLYPKGTPEDIKDLSEEVVTIQDLSDLIHLTDATLQYVPNEDNMVYKIKVSEPLLMEGINPMIQSSKEYLYSRGFSEQEIQDMIQENNATESDLIPFVLKWSEASLSESSTTTPVSQFKTKCLGAFSTPLYAKELVVSDYVDCALDAIGINVLAGLSWSGAKTWSKVAAKKAFAAVAKRALGPIGAAITAISFGICLYNKSQEKEPGCVYAIPTPSRIEELYKELTLQN